MSSKIKNHIKIEASPDQVWAILGDLTAAHSWIPGIISAKVQGSNRVCLTADGQEIREEISNYLAENYTFSYQHLQQPLPIKNSRGIFTVKAEGTGSLVVWEAEFEVFDPSQEIELVALINGYYQQALESLRQRVKATING
jgi:carbon monoxide dehydrogenase subunit G